MSASAVNYPLAVTKRLYDLRFEPLDAVLYGFPWGHGVLRDSTGPRNWGRDLFLAVGQHLQNLETRFRVGRFARSSGHGIGKTAEVAQIIWWGMSCFEDCRIIVTANTKTQLDTKTQPEVSKWLRMAINAEDFEINVASIKVRDAERERAWRTDFIPWSEDNPQAFAGLHNKNRIIIVICDEASEISDTIFKVIEGALTDEDTIILFFQFGNPTRNQGHFYESVFGDMRHRWNTEAIDSRNVEGTNKEQLKEWEEDYGEDSDFFRVRARGLPPRAASGQYIDLELIKNAQARIARSLPDDPLVAGVDFAWGGADDNVVRFRKGYDARSIPPIKVRGEFTRRPEVMIHKISDVLSREYEIGGRKQKVSMLFADSAGIAGPVIARVRALGFKNVTEVNFMGFSPDPKAAYWRDCMWMRMREWLTDGAIDRDKDLESDLSKPILVGDLQQRVKLESKEQMFKRLKQMGLESTSPDDGDALALTFAMPVVIQKRVQPSVPKGRIPTFG